MTLKESLIQKFEQLPANQQLEVLKYVQGLEQKQEAIGPRHDPRGILSDQLPDLTLEDFKQLRKEAWAGFPRDIKG